jgi:PAS domain S-box-containing protein
MDDTFSVDLAFVREQLRAIDDPIALLEGFFGFVPVGLQIYRADGRMLLVNRAFMEMFGSAPPPEYNVLHDEIAKRNGMLDLIHRAFAGETIKLPPLWYDPRELQQVDVTVGKRAAIETTLFPLRDREAKVAHVALVFRDATAEMLAEQRNREALERERAALAEAELQRNRLDAVLRQLPLGVAIADAGGRITMMNDRGRELLAAPDGKPSVQERVSTTEPLRVDGSAYAARELPMLRALNDGEIVRGEEVLIRRADGTRAIMQISAAPIRDASGAIVSAVATFEDVSQERRRESELRRLVDADLMGVAYWGQDARLDDANAAFLRMIGYEPEDLAGGALRLAALAVPGTEVRDLPALQALAVRAGGKPFEHEFVRKDGSRVPVLLGASPIDRPQ